MFLPTETLRVVTLEFVSKHSSVCISAALHQLTPSCAKTVLSQFDPELIVVSSRCPEALLDMLRDFGESEAAE